MRLALVSLFAAAALAQQPAATDTPSRFHAECTVSLLGHATFRSPCMSEDMAASGFNNRFRWVIANPEGALPMARIADYGSTSATANGHMRWVAILVGFIEFRPLDPAIRSAMVAGAPGYEVRAQNMTMTYLPGGALEILIEEPWADFNGKEPSADWLARNRDAHLLRSHSH